MDQQLTQLTEHIWLLPHNPDVSAVQSSIGVVVTQNESLLIDAGNSPRLARKLKTELARYNLPPVSRIIYTHHHWDHVYGACEFTIPVMAHAMCRTILEEEAKKPWGTGYLDEEIKRNPKLKLSYEARKKNVKDWGSFRIIVPEEVFDETVLIEWGKFVIELEHVGGAHAADSIVVKIPQDGVMFLGDCYYLPPLHLRKPDYAPSFDMLRRLQNSSYNLYVESHDKPFTRTQLLEFLQKNS